MRSALSVTALIAVAGLAAPALAQDSVARSTVSDGDALSPWGAQQRTAYVVDLAPHATSQGTVFGVAPILKAARASSGFYNNLMSAQFLSNDLLQNVPYASESYALWTEAGGGVNPTANDPNLVSPVAPTGTSSQFAAAFAEFGTGDGNTSYNGIVAGLINYSPAQPNRLYVTRIQAAVNSTSGSSGDVSQFGMGSIDAHGNLFFRADGNQISGIPGEVNVSGNNYLRVRTADRGTGLNLITGNLSASDVTDSLLAQFPSAGSTSTHSTPNHVPQSAAGGNGLVAGVSFDGPLLRGGSWPLISNTAHLAPNVPAVRGAVGSTAHVLLGSGVTTLGTVARNPGNTATTAFNIWAMDASGGVTDTLGIVTPSSVTDNDDGFTIAYTGSAEYRMTTGSTPFRGGNGQLALGQDQAQRGLAAATMYENGLNDDFSTQIVVARFDENGQNVEWTLAAYIDQNFLSGNSGKAVKDANGNTVGVLSPLFNVTGGSPLGPSMSAPVIDGAGNVWFLSSFERFAGLGVGFSTGLFRAIYDPGAFSYELELVFDLGTVFEGQNSDRDYLISFMSIATNAGGPNPSTFWSGNGRSGAWNDSDLTGVDPADPITNGGIVVNASVIYDVDQDGEFEGGANNLGSADETYSVLLYVGYYADEDPFPGCNPADLAPPFGVLDIFDVLEFLTLFEAEDDLADLAPPFGVWDIFDVLEFLSIFEQGCP